ncbi:hypothetical protein ACR6C2_01195 [Streptomyces sp. INA 01156]
MGEHREHRHPDPRHREEPAAPLHGRHEFIGHVLPDTTNASYAGRALTSDLSRLRIGQSAQVLGAWRPSDDSVDIVRISVGH